MRDKKAYWKTPPTRDVLRAWVLRLEACCLELGPRALSASTLFVGPDAFARFAELYPRWREEIADYYQPYARRMFAVPDAYHVFLRVWRHLAALLAWPTTAIRIYRHDVPVPALYLDTQKTNDVASERSLEPGSAGSLDPDPPSERHG